MATSAHSPSIVSFKVIVHEFFGSFKAYLGCYLTNVGFKMLT